MQTILRDIFKPGYKTLSAVFVLLLGCFHCFGQMTYFQLKPGKSTKKDVEKFLGQPLSKTSETLIEYKPRNETDQFRLFVQYRAGSSIVEQIAKVFARPQSRADLISRYVDLKILFEPVNAVAAAITSKGKLEEYLNGGIVLTHESDSIESKVVREAYYSERAFKAALSVPDPGFRADEGRAKYSGPPRIMGTPSMVLTLEGSVKMKKADGSIQPVEQAIVDIYGVDRPAEFHTKTDTAGRFAQIVFSGSYTIVVSAPGMRWTHVQNVRIGQNADFPMIAEPGDGSRPSKADLIAMGILPNGN